MKKLKKITFKEAKDVHENLSIEKMRQLIGGVDIKTDCLFDCLGYLMYTADSNSGLGPNDPRLSQEDYAAIAQRAYNNDYQDANLGVDSTEATSFISRYYDTVHVPSGLSAINATMSSGAGVIMALNNGGNYHAVVLTGISTMRIGSQDGIVSYRYYDPQNRVYGTCNVNIRDENGRDKEHKSVYIISAIDNIY